MCGIVVLVSKQGGEVPQTMLDDAVASIAHRGPDDRRTLFFENAAIGFCRLSIVDEQGGGQPLFNEDESIALVCNGEIYNYRALREELRSRGHQFRTGSDSEVIVHLYEEVGEKLLERLDGMFAFVLLDRKRKRLFAARDRVGIKPLMISEDNRYLCLASEAKALFATGIPAREFDHRGIVDFFTFNYIPGERTAFRDISNLLPGHSLSVDLTAPRSEPKEYWQPGFPPAKNAIARLGPWAKRLRETLRDAVESHTIGDRPVAAYLSGGIDSTVTTVLLKQFHQGSLTTFSIGFPGTECDESSVYRETARRLSLDSRELQVSEIGAADFRQALHRIEQPQSSLLDVPMQRLAALVRSSGVKVVLSGEGSDELLGGYSVYTLNQIRRALSMPGIEGVRDHFLPIALRYYLRYEADVQFYRRVFSEDIGSIIRRFGTFPAWYPVWIARKEASEGIFREATGDSLGDDSSLARLAAPLKERYAHIDDFNKSLYLELRTRLPNYILHRADRNSMASSVEQRVPFLSNGMIDLASEIPPILKMFGLREKYVLRKAFKKLVPAPVLKRMKFGYRAPLDSLWENPDELRDEVLSTAAISRCGVFDDQVVANLLRELRETKDLRRKGSLREVLTGVLSVQLLGDAYGI